jgi:hypothetical protein
MLRAFIAICGRLKNHFDGLPQSFRKVILRDDEAVAESLSKKIGSPIKMIFALCDFPLRSTLDAPCFVVEDRAREDK